MNMEKIPHGKAGFGSTVTIREIDGAGDDLPARDAGGRRRRKGAHLHVARRSGGPLLNKEEGDEIAVTTPNGCAQVRDHEARHDSRRVVFTPDARLGYHRIERPTSCQDRRISELIDDRTSEPSSPERRTALVLSGTGADGAYHAGVLRALHETGIKVDMVGGRGIGALGAVLHAIDGAARLWEPGGLWRARGASANLSLALAVPMAARARPRAPRRCWRSRSCSSSRLLPCIRWPGSRHGGLRRRARASLEALSSYTGSAFGPGALPTWIPRVTLAIAGRRGSRAVGWMSLERRPSRTRRSAVARSCLVAARRANG